MAGLGSAIREKKTRGSPGQAREWHRNAGRQSDRI